MRGRVHPGQVYLLHGLHISHSQLHMPLDIAIVKSLDCGKKTKPLPACRECANSAQKGSYQPEGLNPTFCKATVLNLLDVMRECFSFYHLLKVVLFTLKMYLKPNYPKPLIKHPEER